MRREDEIPEALDGTPPPPSEAPRVTADDTTRVPTTPSNDPPTDGEPVPKAEPFPLTDLGRPARDDDYTPEAIDRDQADDLGDA